MEFGFLRCITCGRTTTSRCLFCRQPVCSRCQTRHKGKVYCSPLHRDNDRGIGKILRKSNPFSSLIQH